MPGSRFAAAQEIDADGSPRWADLDALSDALDGEFSPEQICSQRFLAPLAPPAAAAIEGREVDDDALNRDCDVWRSRCDLLIVEGAGGFLCPLTDRRTFADLAVEIGFPVLVVAANRLGTVNHTLLTLEAIARRGLTLAGLVLNDIGPVADESAEGHAELIQRFAGVPWLGRVMSGERRIETRRGALTGLDLQLLAASRNPR